MGPGGSLGPCPDLGATREFVPSVSGNPWEIAAARAEGGVSGGAGARKPRAGGCARSLPCRRSGRSRWCSRSARSCTAARVGSALGIHRCLTGGSDRCGPRLASSPRTVPPSPGPALRSRTRCSPTQRAREASSWKPPGHSHTAPPGRGTQRPLTQRHSSESSSELSSSMPAGETRTSTPPC